MTYAPSGQMSQGSQGTYQELDDEGMDDEMEQKDLRD